MPPFHSHPSSLIPFRSPSLPPSITLCSFSSGQNGQILISRNTFIENNTKEKNYSGAEYMFETFINILRYLLYNLKKKNKNLPSPTQKGRKINQNEICRESRHIFGTPKFKYPCAKRAARKC